MKMKLHYGFDLPPYHEDGRKRGEHEPQTEEFEYEVDVDLEDYANYLCPANKDGQYRRGYVDAVIDVLENLFSYEEAMDIMADDDDFRDYLSILYEGESEEEFYESKHNQML